MADDTEDQVEAPVGVELQRPAPINHGRAMGFSQRGNSVPQGTDLGTDETPAPEPQVATSESLPAESFNPQSDVARAPDDKQARYAAARAKVNQQAQAAYQEAYSRSQPVNPNGPIVQPLAYRQAEQQSDREYQQSQVEQRRQRMIQNQQAQAQAQATGQKMTRDANGNLVPELEPRTNRPLYHSTPWSVGKDPKTGEPALTMIDQYGQRQFKAPKVVSSPDLTDNQLYYQMPDGTQQPAGNIDELTKHPNFTIARQAMQAARARRAAIWKEATAPLEDVATQASTAYDLAKQRNDDLQTQADQLQEKLGSYSENQLNETQGGILGIGGSPTANAQKAQTEKAAVESQLGQIQAEQAKIAEQLKPGGQLHRAQQQARIDLAIFKAKAAHDNYADLADERRAILRSQGKSEAGDATLQSILQAQQTYGAAISRYGSAMQKTANLPTYAKPAASGAAPGTTPTPIPAQAVTPPNSTGERLPLGAPVPGKPGVFESVHGEPHLNDPVAGEPAAPSKYTLASQTQAPAQPEATASTPQTSAPAGQPQPSPTANAASDVAPTQEQASEPFALAQKGQKSVGGVSIPELARRYGSGQGEVSPQSLIKLKQRSGEIADMLANGGTQLDGKVVNSLNQEKDYLDALYTQRFARLPVETQNRITELTREPTLLDKAKGAVKSAAEAAATGGGAALKGLQALADVLPVQSTDEFGKRVPGSRHEAQRRAAMTPAQRLEDIKQGPAYQLGTFIQDAAKETYAKNPHENEGVISQALNAAAEAAGGFAPLVASGPAAPLTIGLQTAGSELESTYQDRIAKGSTPDQAADYAIKRALLSGALQSAIFEVLPKPLQKLADKVIVNRLAKGALSRFLANRVAQAGEGATLGATSAVASNLATGKPATENLAQSAGGLALAQAVMPRAAPQRPEAKPETAPPDLSTPPDNQRLAPPEPFTPTGEGLPKTAKESAEVLAPGETKAAKEAAAQRPAPIKSAEESAMAIKAQAELSRRAAAKEERAQKIVDDLQQTTGKSRGEILATREGKPIDDWIKELDQEDKYQKNPLVVDPERRANELREQIKQSDADWQKHLDKLAADSEAAAQGDQTKAAALERFNQVKSDALARHEELRTRREAIESELTAAERLRQSPQGAAKLKEDLAAKANVPAGEKMDIMPEMVKQEQLREKMARDRGEEVAVDPNRDQNFGKPKPEAKEDPVADRKRYEEIQGELRRLTKEGKTFDDPEVAALFKENEQLKNRNSSDPGMPPEPISEPKNQPKETTNAIQKPSTGETAVRQAPAGSQGVRQENAVDQGAAAARQPKERGEPAPRGEGKPVVRAEGNEARTAGGEGKQDAGQAGEKAVRAEVAETEGFKKLNPLAQKRFNAAYDAKNARLMGEYLDPQNPSFRAEFEQRTGVKLPKTIGGTEKAVADHFAGGEKAVSAEAKPVSLEVASGEVPPAPTEQERIEQGTKRVGDTAPKVKSKLALAREYLGPRPDPKVNYPAANQWDKNLRRISQWTPEEIQSRIDNQNVEHTRQQKVDAGTKELYPEISKVAEEGGSSWRTALKQRAAQEGIDNFNPPMTVTKGEAAAQLARRITERRLNQAKPETKPEAKPESKPEVKPETPKAPEVAPEPKPTDDGAKVAATPTQDKAVSKLADRKQLKVQKEFLQDALKKAEADAPEEQTYNAKGEKMIERAKQIEEDYYDPKKDSNSDKVKVKADAQELAREAGITGSAALNQPIPAILSDARGRITQEHGDILTVEVPNDGTFRIPHTKAALKAFGEVVRKGFGKGIGPLYPERGYHAPAPPTLTAVARKSTPEGVTEALQLSASDDPTRYALSRVVQDGKYTVATDGRRLTVALNGDGIPLDKDMMIKGLKDKDGKPVKFPNWRQVVPKFLGTRDGKISIESGKHGAIDTTVDTGELLRTVSLAAKVTSEKSNSVVLHDLGDGKIGVSAQSADFGDYHSDGVESAPADHAQLAMNPSYLMDALDQARKMGHEKVRIIAKGDESSPLIVTDGKTFASITMPVRMPEQTALTSPKAPTPAPKETPLPEHLVKPHAEFVEASKQFDKARDAFRARGIDEATFVAEKQKFDAAQKAYDAAEAQGPTTTDKIISALQNAKINKPGEGKVFSSDPLSLAYDAALDTAILGIKAGRSLAHMIQLALTRFRAAYPKATRADEARLEQAIREAHGSAGEAKPESKPEAVAQKKAAEVLSSPKVEQTKTTLIDRWNKAAKTADLKQTLAYTRDVADNQAGNTAKETRETVANELARNVPKADLPLAEEALGFHVEAGKEGRKALAEMKAKIEASTKANPKWKAKAIEAIDYADKHYEDLKSTADLYNQFTDQQVNQEQAAGMPTLKRENYVMHAQDVDEGGWLDRGGGMSPTGASNRKNRVYDTHADSIAAGVDPKTLNAVDLLQTRVKNGQTGINLREWQKSLHNYVDPTTKEPLAMPSPRVERADGSYYYQPPKGYENEFLNGTPISVKKEYAGIIGALTDPSWWGKTKERRLIQKVNGAGKSINLLIDTFHLGRLALRQSILKGASLSDFRVPLPSYNDGRLILEHSADELARMAKNGEVAPEALPDLLAKKKNLNLLTSAGLNTGHIADAMHQEFVRSIPGIGDINKFIFEKFQRGAMSEAALMEFDRQSKMYPELKPAEVARKVAKDINTRFGNLGRQGIFKSRTAQDIARLIWLAPQWNEGLIRSELGGVGQIATSIKDAVTGKRLAMGALGRDMIAGTLGIFAANQIINQMTRGKFTWENPEEGWGSKLSAWIPDRVGGKGAGFFLNPLGVTAEISHLLLNNYERTESGWQTAVNFFRSRASAISRPAWTAATKETALGAKIKPQDMTKEIAKSAAPVPIGGGAAVSALRGAINHGNTEDYPGQFQKQVMQSVGLKTDTAPSPEQRIGKLAKDFNKTKKIEPKAEFYAGDYTDMDNALRRDNADDIKEELTNLLKKVPAEKIAQHYRSWANHPFTGQGSREAEFIRTLNPEQKRTYLQAKKNRLEVGGRALKAINRLPPSLRASPVNN